MPTVLVSGAGRGLGLEFVRQYAADGWRVIAGVRDPARATELAAVAAPAGGRVAVHPLDVARPESIAALAAVLRGTAIDVLLNNAGTMGAQSFGTGGSTIQRFGATDYADWTTQFEVNVLGPMRMAEAFVEHVAASTQKKIVTLTSMLGSVGGNTVGGFYAYRSTKAAANAVMKSMAIDLARRGIVAAPVHPGWARTAMGGPRATVDPVEAVTGVRRVIAGLTPAGAGQFWQYDGTQLAW